MPFDGTEFAGSDNFPTLRPRRNKRRLDLRPAIWSLRNRPEEWKMSLPGYIVIHIPSDHRFWISFGSYAMPYLTGECSCEEIPSRNAPSFIDRWNFMLAFRAWRKGRLNRESDGMVNINRQFASHFFRLESANK
jgi:hypothetical protein